MSAMAATYNMVLYQAATFVKQLRWLDSEGKPIDLRKPIDLTGYKALMQVRLSHNHDEVVIELSTENGRIFLEETEGKIQLIVDAESTKKLLPALYVYDLLLISAGGIATRLIEGQLTVKAAVSRL